MVVGKNTRCSPLKFSLVLFESFHCILCGWHFNILHCVVCFRERERRVCVCVYTAIFIHKGQTPSFVVLIAESKRRGADCIPVRIHLDVRSLTLSLSKEAFGLELSNSALSESEMQTFFYSARMWWLRLCQDPPWLMRPYLEGQCILGSKPFPVVGPREFIPSMHLSKASKENCALLMLREWRLSLH